MADLSKSRVIAVGGPTASGKTALSVGLAKAFGGEIINADSMQIYKNLDVGTAKPSIEERQGVPHYLLDFLPPETPYSVADFTAAADPLIQEITARGKLPLVVGGTGLYITSLLNGMAFAPEKTDPAIRARLQERAEAEGGAALYAELQSIDPDYAAQVHPNNLPRVIRALELYAATGRRMSEERVNARPAEPPYRSLCLCLTCRDRAVLYDRIERRVNLMVENGVLAEAKQVYDHRDTYRTAAQAIGYKEFFPYFEGTGSLDECTARLKQATRNYAKRQLTWFRRQNDAVWLYIDEENVLDRACELVREFLQQ
ncbi:tRNA (adenosine(37)-N6)-dimethylallyltransferase MiaA [Gemmiger formicilis]|uniref:tRNA (adenosine(37)-N6)-dimethylallyltransferase MiaA n=1 Tax=Gemmiger formicilis TaxID=745368 RepID=UPI00210DE8ED|nr:tRNA (adenosine(37)-N6)-dimethylallyltransferase MiaA [Gemmiger formicilis]MCQ5078418.1 tRNA (adenosine(37)-N6)-dimethylallyltransferase MiaA [Gemmiger formicilis]MCQ5115147.1 tRNA (adenosine(37)-N6)-dimethylallyltransferase MiaA [Gemmiger formicilis]